MRSRAALCAISVWLTAAVATAQPGSPPPSAPPTAALPPVEAQPPEAQPPAPPAVAAPPAATAAAPAYPAYGEPPPPPPSGGAGYGAPAAPPPPPHPERAGVHTHDSFYLRFGFGGGGLSEVHTYDPEGAFPKRTVSGGSYGGHFMLGGTVAKGFVIGAAMGGIIATGPDVETAGTTITGKDTTLNLSHLGLLLDWFPDEHGGFHVGGSLGLYTMLLEVDGEIAREAASGGGGQLFVGYDFWVGDDWSIGGLLALTHASMELDDDQIKHTTGGSASATAVMLQASVLYH